MKSRASMDFKFGENGKFKILAIGDCHEKPIYNEKTVDMLNLLNKAAEQLKPDLAIFMGDIVSDWNRTENRPATEEEVFEEINRVCEPFYSRNIPIGITFGNHDGERNGTKSYLFSLYSRIPGFINTDTAGTTGVGNCYVPIYDKKGEKMLFNLWLIDSGSSAQDGSGGYAWVDNDQIEWYENTCDEIAQTNGGKVVPSIVFQHIPVCEEYRLLKETTFLNPYRVRGDGMYSRKFYTKGIDCHGYLGEGPCVPARNNGQFRSWKANGDVVAAVFGHDHMNSFQGEVEGILLCQTKCSGFHMYGDGLRQGVRLIELDETRPADLTTKMYFYRDFFGTKCNSIKGYDLLTDRWHTNFKITLAVLSTAAALTTASVVTKKVCTHIKKTKSIKKS